MSVASVKTGAGLDLYVQANEKEGSSMSNDAAALVQPARRQRKMPRSPNVVIEVTQEAINEAIREDSSHCMIADAIKAQLPNAESVSVDLQSIRWSDRKRGLRYTYLTPAIAQVNLLSFDQGIKPEPFKFSVKKAHISRMNVKGTHTDKIPRRATLIHRDGHGGTIPERVGGRAPGRGALSNDAPRITGKRRAFGLRAMGRVRDDRKKEVDGA